MQWTLDELKRDAASPLAVHETLALRSELQARDREVLDATAADVQGIILYEDDTVLLQVTVSVTVTLPSSRSLEPVAVPLSFSINERYIPTGVTTKIRDDKSVVTLALSGNEVSLDQAVTENILTHLPMTRLTPAEEQDDSMPSGDSWEVMSEDAFKHRKHQDVDPRLAALKNVFPDNDEDA